MLLKKTFQKTTGLGIECTRCAYKSSFKLRLIFPLSKWNDNPLLCILFCRLHQQQQQHQPIFVGGHGDEEMGGMSKACCGVTVTQAVSIRWFIVMIAFVGICCSVVGTVLGAMKASGREHLTVSLLMIGKDRMVPIYVCTIHLEFWTFLLLRTLLSNLRPIWNMHLGCGYLRTCLFSWFSWRPKPLLTESDLHHRFENCG